MDFASRPPPQPYLPLTQKKGAPLLRKTERQLKDRTKALLPTGRSLGGHMRCHFMASSPMEDEEKPASRYGLRDNPKKSQRFENVSLEKVKPSKLRPLLNSSSASGLSGDELNHEEGDREVTMIPMPVKKKRKRGSRKVTKNSAYCTPPAPLPPEYASEEEIGALCLWMLSRGIHSITESADKISPIIEFRNKVGSFPSEDEDQQFKKPKNSSFSRNGDHCNAISSVVLKIGKRSSSNECDSESGMENFYKRRRYVCTICSKSFPSYQALGGHRTSHNKMKGDQQELINQNCDSHTMEKSLENFKSHDCSICGRKFLSGQALGGHKRSHLVAADNSFSTQNF